MSDDGAIPLPAIPALPVLSPQEIREGMVADEIRMAARNGVKLEPREAERVVARDLDFFQAIQRNATPAPRYAETSRAQRKADRQDRKEQALATVNARNVTPGRAVTPRKSRVLQAKSLPTERWSYAKGRIIRICEGMSVHANPVVATRTATCPDLALEVLKLQVWAAVTHMRRHTGEWGPEPAGERNPFWGLSPADFGRVLMRLTEDICDRSSAKLGPWWVPK